MPSMTLALSIRSSLYNTVFSPATLFAFGEQGVWYDPSDLTTLFQDAAGTTPVTTAGQTVGLALDKSKGLVLGPNIATVTSITGFPIGGPPFTNYQLAPAMVVGRAYEIRITVSGYSGSGTVGITDSIGRFEPDLTSSNISGNGTISVIGIAGSADVIQIFTRSTNTANFYNISVKELSGNHATQATAAARPTYGVVPSRGRVNLLTRTEEFGDAAWSKISQGTGVAPVLSSGFTDPDGTNTAWRLQLNAGSNGSSDYSLIRQSNPTWLDTGTRSIWLRSNTGSNQSVSLVATSVASRVTVTPTWQRFEQTIGAGSKQIDISVGGTGATGATADILIWHPQVEDATTTPYQRVGSAFDVTEADVQTLHYLSFDGVDDFLVAPTIPPGIDKVQVFAGVRKLSDAATGILVEFSPTLNSNSGSFYITAPTNTSSRDFLWLSRGSITSPVGASSGPLSAPTTRIITGFSDISTGNITLRINSTQVSQIFPDQGTGNFLAYPLYIGRRGGTSLPFNGNLYGLTVRFGANLTPTQIIQAETYLAAKTGVTL